MAQQCQQRYENHDQKRRHAGFDLGDHMFLSTQSLDMQMRLNTKTTAHIHWPLPNHKDHLSCGI